MAKNRKAKASLKRLQENLSAARRNMKKKGASWKYPSPAPDQGLQRGRKPVAAKKHVDRKETPTLGLGYAASHEGMTVGHTVVAGHIVSYVASSCSCGGENPNCFRCDGTGFYVMERIGNEVVATSKRKKKAQKSQGHAVPTEASFSNDARGGDYSIRESGRFLSNPLHDDYDDESTS